ncbi:MULTISPECIES: tripartite tricarboxylate transporter substrate-binding protein [unclassified Acidovorax]|jgi:tripartite-type tricarboxylate transporter receptor subunit TctC|uniref:Bug family tripartite tricarboxylate transporter substrate binding protein n=1 Tax=unclassified Acidovorax TaxID=2684926 RepID=UPI000BCCECBE|nr:MULTISPECIES: tripartite tricarboxylate transporter substrate-binding protein [unclassified Acidovorax]HQS19913.1 tripartite tricarboxylate transporter substrate-binding protein [Acidovorax defluvii]OYY30040.1 MAG: ABC transporter substrate-binding protein [Acidovorax sp. 35-64-16]OYY87282.1 MAG: ABC transporter substrate-binding protein [Acidovorax sp. 28-64-14]OYZ45564.1 MAG: ABC transporter substrate-binding protein [Acidovorax sp. 16-64-162]OYZ69633.1 MAG: ABC transporter substrate-bind
MHTLHLSRRAALACSLAVLASAPAVAQEASYPSKPITIVVGYPPGGSTDLTGRVVATELGNRLGVPVVIENIGGAGGAIGAQKVASAAPDGYTLLVGASNEIAINKLVTKKVKYDIKDFTAIGLIASQPLVLVASTGSGVKNLAEFTQKVSKNPGKFSYGSSGVGTSLHLAGEMVKEQGKLFMTHIPYRGVAPLTNDLMGNNLEYGVFVLSSGLPHIKSGKVIALGTTEANRSAATPDIPAISESAQYKNVAIGVWFALMAPAHLPKPVFDKLKKALNEALQAPELRKKLESSGSTVSSPSVNIDKFLAAEVAKYKQIVEFAKIEE